ncbi:MAG: hypothetical protein OEZ65_01440 [Gemmatimonadota bacterium]|nr:hypothetical protein [Gemmatimonadota bacterium]MDH5758220.1 hypothetical protein [Gemmatimonadota bacterium]
MRAALLLVILVAASPVAGQDTATTASPPRPAEVVADLARRALTDPEDPGTWRALAGALPEMALSGGADLDGTFEAARLADSLGIADARQPVAPASRLPWESWNLGPEHLFAGSVALTLLVGALVVRSSIRRRKARRSARKTEMGGRLWAARSLASDGISVAEISKRTGMAQDAVRVVLGLSAPRKSPTWAPKPGYTVRPPRVVPAAGDAMAGQRAEWKAEIVSGARRLRDGRLTY